MRGVFYGAFCAMRAARCGVHGNRPHSGFRIAVSAKSNWPPVFRLLTERSDFVCGVRAMPVVSRAKAKFLPFCACHLRGVFFATRFCAMRAARCGVHGNQPHLSPAFRIAVSVQVKLAASFSVVNRTLRLCLRRSRNAGCFARESEILAVLRMPFARCFFCDAFLRYASGALRCAWESTSSSPAFRIAVSVQVKLAADFSVVNRTLQLCLRRSSNASCSARESGVLAVLCAPFARCFCGAFLRYASGTLRRAFLYRNGISIAPKSRAGVCGFAEFGVLFSRAKKWRFAKTPNVAKPIYLCAARRVRKILRRICLLHSRRSVCEFAQKVLIGGTHAGANVVFGFPAEGAQQRGVAKFARRSVGL